MKNKLICMLLVLAVCLSLGACGADNTNTGESIGSVETTPAETTPAETRPVETTPVETTPAEIVLTVDNVSEYFTLKNVYSTAESDYTGAIHAYYSKITGEISVEPCVTLERMKNVSMTICVTCTVGYKVDGTLNAEEEYRTFDYNVDIAVSAGSGSGSGSYCTDGNYASYYWYPSITVSNIEVTAVTGTVTPA